GAGTHLRAVLPGGCGAGTRWRGRRGPGARDRGTRGGAARRRYRSAQPRGRGAVDDYHAAGDGPRTISGTDGGGDGLGGLERGRLRLGHRRRIPAGVPGVISRVVILVGTGVDEVGA